MHTIGMLYNLIHNFVQTALIWGLTNKSYVITMAVMPIIMNKELIHLIIIT